MSSYDHKGIANLLSLPLKAPVRTPRVETQEDPILSLSESLMRIKALEIPKNSEPKDEYGYTKKQNREIEKYLKLFEHNVNMYLNESAHPQQYVVQLNI